MWSRQDLKQKGKAVFKANYWKYVLVSFILMALLGAGAGTAKKGAPNEKLTEALNSLSSSELSAVFAILGATLLICMIISILFTLFVTNPIMVGAYRFFIKGSTEETADLNNLVSSYKDGNFMKIFVTMFLKQLYTMLWSLLLVIPGIVKGYSYRMVPYILAENPDMGANEIITKSREMMKGNKWKAFVLDLSFLGWVILGCCTFGILNIFYVNPYILATDAELYNAIKNN